MDERRRRKLRALIGLPPSRVDLGFPPATETPIAFRIKNMLPYLVPPVLILALVSVSYLTEHGYPGDSLFLGLMVAYAMVTAWTMWHHPSRRRANRLRYEASMLGLRPGRADFDLRSFVLLGADPSGEYENAFRGEVGGQEVQVFDYWNSMERRWLARHKWLACGATRVPLSGPRLIIRPRDVIDEIEDMGLATITLDLDAFNRSHEVRCDDARFATAVLDQRLVRAIEEDLHDWGFELHRGILLAVKRGHMRRQDRPKISDTLGAVAVFFDHLPDVAYDLYP